MTHQVLTLPLVTISNQCWVDISMELDIHIDIDHVIKESTYLVGT
jgi:hypothetical protein